MAGRRLSQMPRRSCTQTLPRWSPFMPSGRAGFQLQDGFAGDALIGEGGGFDVGRRRSAPARCR